MTAASGVVHEEMRGKDFTIKGGRFEMVQLWVDLPARRRLSKRRSLAIYAASIAVAPVEPWISCACYVIVAIIWLVPDRRIEREIAQ